MANTIDSGLIPSIIGFGREALSENMAYLGMVSHNYADAQMKLGKSVEVPIPAILTAESVTSANVAPAPTAVTNDTTSLTVDKFYKTSFAYSVTDMQNYDVMKWFQEQMKEAVRGLAKQINSDLITEGWNNTPYAVGNAGTGFFASNYDSLLDARSALLGRNVDVANLSAVISLKDAAALGKIDQVQNANQFGTRDLNVFGMAGRVAGFDIWEDQQATANTKGTITGDPVMGAAAVTAKTTVITCDADDSIALKAGDLIAVDGATYAVQADLTVGNSATGTLTVDRNWETALDGDEALAFATASDGDAGVYDAASLRNLCGDFRGLASVIRRPAGGVTGFETQGMHFPITEEKSGATFNLAIYPQYHQTAFEVSAVYGVRLVDSRRFTRILSYSS
jgi:hypothetical protein